MLSTLCSICSWRCEEDQLPHTRTRECICMLAHACTHLHPPHTHLMSAEALHTNTEEHTHDHAHTGAHEHTHTQRHTQDVSHLCSQSVIPPRLPLCLPLSSSCSPFEVCYVFLEGWYYCAQPPPLPASCLLFSHPTILTPPPQTQTPSPGTKPQLHPSPPNTSAPDQGLTQLTRIPSLAPGLNHNNKNASYLSNV